jgi:acetyl-CoA carboxylase biotin carboxyl carrier protein
MDIEQIKELMKMLEESKLAKLVVKRGDVEIHLEKGAPAVRKEVVHPIQEELAPRQEKPIPSAPSHDANHAFITSPMVGTFYSASAPDQPPFAKVGDRVDPNTILCIIEAMKVMNEVKAGMKGIIVEVLVDTAHPVEFGTRLFKIMPHG